MGVRKFIERRSVSYQDVWGSGGNWESATTSGYSPVEALGLSAVIACLKHRAGLVSQLPLSAYTERNGFSALVPLQPSLIRRPTSTVQRSVWLSQMMISRDLWGNAFGAITSRDAAGYPTACEWLSPTIVDTRQDFINGPVVYTVNGQPFAADDMLLIPSLFNLPGSPLGIPPLKYSGLVDLGRRAQDFGADWFRNGAVPSSVIYSDQTLTSEQAESIRDRVTSAWRRRMPGVLGAGLKLEHVKVEKNESQFNETITHVGGQVCQAFGVAPEEVGLVGTGSSITYANRTDAKQASIDRMNPDMVLIEEALTDELPPPQFAKFNTGAYLRGDIGTRFNQYATGIGAGFLTVDEARAFEDWGPMRSQGEPDAAA